VIAVQNLTHRYGERVALANVSFEVQAGEIFGLLGPNGGGKSSLFRILSTMMSPTEGRAAVAGHDVSSDAAGVRRSAGVVFQTQSLDKQLTVEENKLQAKKNSGPRRLLQSSASQTQRTALMSNPSVKGKSYKVLFLFRPLRVRLHLLGVLSEPWRCFSPS